MTFNIYNYAGDPSKINKAGSLGTGVSMTGTLREPANMVTPEILAEIDPSGYNYAYISEFGRYYWIVDAQAVRNGLFRIRMKSDPLASFAGQILALPAYCTRTENVFKQTPYIIDPKAPFAAYDDVSSFVLGSLASAGVISGYDVLITAG